MFGSLKELLSRKISHRGTVHFRGNLSPRAEEFAYLEKAGFAIKTEAPAEGAHWMLRLRHPELGDARLVALRDVPRVPEQLIEWCLSLTDREKAEAAAAGTSAVSVSLESSRGSALRDRKSLLKIMSLVMGDDGCVAADHGSELLWSRAGLADELAAPGEPDVSVLYTIHAVYADGPEDGNGSSDDDARSSVYWLHTHGLERVGGVNVDVLLPSEAMQMEPDDFFRAAAFASLERTLTESTGSFQLLAPGRALRCVPATTFRDRCLPEHRAIFDHGDSDLAQRIVFCEPVGLLGRLTGGRPTPSRMLMELNTDAVVLHFSKAATDHMAERARATLGLLGTLRQELAEFKLPTIAKIGYPTDHGDGQEHLWFEVHNVSDRGIEATLASAPHDIARMKPGERGTHPTERLTDWAIMSPLGKITPHNRTALRRIREDRERLLAMMAMHAAANGSADDGQPAE